MCKMIKCLCQITIEKNPSHGIQRIRFNTGFLNKNVCLTTAIYVQRTEYSTIHHDFSLLKLFFAASK